MKDLEGKSELDLVMEEGEMRREGFGFVEEESILSAAAGAVLL